MLVLFAICQKLMSAVIISPDHVLVCPNRSAQQGKGTQVIFFECCIQTDHCLSRKRLPYFVKIFSLALWYVLALAILDYCDLNQQFKEKLKSSVVLVVNHGHACHYDSLTESDNRRTSPGHITSWRDQKCMDFQPSWLYLNSTKRRVATKKDNQQRVNMCTSLLS